MNKVKNQGARIRELLKEGKNTPEISKILGVCKATISYHRKKIGMGIFIINKNIYDWKEIDRYINDGHSLLEASNFFRINKNTLSIARRRGDLTYKTIERLTAEEYSKTIIGKAQSNNRELLIKKMVREGTSYECVECHLSDKWNNKPLRLQYN